MLDMACFTAANPTNNDGVGTVPSVEGNIKPTRARKQPQETPSGQPSLSSPVSCWNCRMGSSLEQQKMVLARVCPRVLQHPLHQLLL